MNLTCRQKQNKTLPACSYDGIKTLGAPSTAATYNYQSKLMLIKKNNML